MITKAGASARHPCLHLLLLLERHGVTIAELEAWVHFLEAHKTGSVRFHASEGQVIRYEERSYRRVGGQTRPP